MAIDRAVEARKKAKASREARLKKSKVKAAKTKKKIGKGFKAFGKGLKGFGKRLGIGQTKEQTDVARAEHKAKKAKKSEGKVWESAVAKQKKAGGPSMSTLVKARGMHEKGSSDYAKIQNQINKAMGSRYRHSEEAEAEKKQAGGMVEPSPSPSYKKGGKVESNPYDWPTRDARSGFGKKK